MQEKTIYSIILAGGKGTRIKSRSTNKVTLSLSEKPLITYGTDLLLPLSSQVIVVVGAYAESVQKTLGKIPSLIYAYQSKRLGTGHAVKIALNKIKTLPQKPEIVLTGYGDHLMFYDQKTIKDLIELHQKTNPTISLISSTYQNPNELAWGRIIRNKKNEVIDIIEQKDATEEQKKIQEINPGFYCFDYQFLNKNISKIKKSPMSQEYYLTDMIKIAFLQGQKVRALKVPFEKVGIGINTNEELQDSQKLYRQTRNLQK